VKGRNLVFAALALFLTAALARADAIVTYAESPGAQTPDSALNANVQTFDSIVPGDYSSKRTAGAATIYNNFVWAGVGTYSAVAVRTANEYGGADGTGYYPVTSTSSSLGDLETSTLTFDTPQQYFGIWWSAGDSKNVLQFYDGSTCVALFNTQNLVDKLPSTYDGNPNKAFLGQDSAEGFAYVNFFATAGTEFTSVVFTNNGSSGFESDNHAVADWVVGDAMVGVGLEQVNGAGTITELDTDYGDTPVGAPTPNVAGASLLLLMPALALLGRKRNAVRA